MTVRQTIRLLHRWLGIASGVVVFLVALSGVILVFEDELRDSLEDYRHVHAGSGPLLVPSQLKSIAEEQFPGETASRVYCEGPRRAAYVQFGNHRTYYYKLVYVHPCDGRVLQVKNMNYDFLHLVRTLHERFLLPFPVGRRIVDYGTLLFVVLLISGLINWWPRCRSAIRQRFAIKWQARWRRRNYDLHNVLGFYAFSVMLIIALTGMLWGFEWFHDVVHWIASAGETRQPYEPPASTDRYRAIASPLENVDAMWVRLAQRHPNAEVMFVFLPETPDASIRYTVNPDRRTYYKTDHYYFDQYSLTELPMRHAWAKYKDASPAQMLRRMNYDIHRGAILGLPGKLLALSASLIAASLPVTGFFIWWIRRRSRGALLPHDGISAGEYHHDERSRVGR